MPRIVPPDFLDSGDDGRDVSALQRSDKALVGICFLELWIYDYLGGCFNERRIQYDRFFSFICNNLRWHIIIGGVKVSIWTKSLLNLFSYIYILGIILLAWIIDIRWSDTLVIKKLTLVSQHCYTWLRFIINEINKWFFFFFSTDQFVSFKKNQ